ncbi:MAG: response regulator [Oscillospiraceae bacterium]|nr:response regulator [Oscillospiraceae bacterium]
MKTIFAVDDVKTNRNMVKDALEGHYKVYTFPDADKMFNLLERIIPDLILLDINMPEKNGFEILSQLKGDTRYKFIPVIFLTGELDPAAEIRGFEMGVIDFIHTPFTIPILIKRIETHIEIDSIIKKNIRAVHAFHFTVIGVIANMVENRDVVTGKHIERTQEYLKILVEELIRTGVYEGEISGWDIDLLLPSAQLHDVGKITISDTILNKPGKLNDEEFAVIKTHSSEGERVICDIIEKTEEGDFLLHAKRFAGSHHEKWNGTGYPRGLREYDIPLEGRIMAVADVYDALVSKRPYKKPFTHEEAVDIIKKDSGTHFDPNIVKAFLNVADVFKTKSEEMLKAIT